MRRCASAELERVAFEDACVINVIPFVERLQVVAVGKLERARCSRLPEVQREVLRRILNALVKRVDRGVAAAAALTLAEFGIIAVPAFDNVHEVVGERRPRVPREACSHSFSQTFTLVTALMLM